jgi:hypothetical protein
MNRAPSPGRWVALIAIAIALIASIITAGVQNARSATETTPDLRAFDRPARASDRPPQFIVRTLPHGNDHIVASRRVATYVDGRGRHAALYAVKTARHICMADSWNNGGGGGCSPPGQFLGSADVTLSFGHLLFGIGDRKVARVVVVGTRGVRHPVSVTRDGGFIYDCKAYNGCSCVVDHVEVFDAHGSKLGVVGQPMRCRKSQSATRSGVLGYTVSKAGRAAAVHAPRVNWLNRHRRADRSAWRFEDGKRVSDNVRGFTLVF